MRSDAEGAEGTDATERVPPVVGALGGSRSVATAGIISSEERERY